MDRLRFGGHESFPPRSPWPTKGVTAVIRDPSVFGREDATVIFGVGKNMVSSIRFWCTQMGLIEASTERGMFRPTVLGEAIFNLDSGLDPYLEYPETLWILHYQLCTHFTPNSIFRLVFGSYPKVYFTRDSLLQWILLQIQQFKADPKISRNTLERDIDILIRTYRTPKWIAKERNEEDSFDSPLAELGLIEEVEPGQYKLQRRSSSAPNPKIIESVLIDHWSEHHSREQVLSFDTLQHRDMSPGRILCLSPDDFAAALETLSHATETIHFDETAGMRSVHLISPDALQTQQDIRASLHVMFGRAS
jgi:hypothetical protein